MAKSKKASKLLSIILPVLNEVDQIKNCVDVIRKVVSDAVDMRLEFIVVDDGSTDGTWQVLDGMAKSDKDVKAVRFSRNFGKENAMYAGLNRSSGDAVVVMDSDLQHPPEVIKDMVSLWENDRYQIVNAVKTSRGEESVIRKYTVSAFYKVFQFLTDVDLQGSSDFKLLDRDVVDSYLRFGERNLFLRGLVPWMGYRTAFVDFEVQERLGGETKWSGYKRLMLAVDAITSFSVIPLQLVTLSGFLFFVFSVLIGLQTLWNWLNGGAVEGFTTVIILLLLMGSILMVSLGIIGQYLSKIYREIKGRPHYILRETAGFSDAKK